MHRSLTMFLVSAFASTVLMACDVPDSMRCPDGMFYVPDIYACCLDEDFWDTEERKCLPQPDGLPDGGEMDTDSDLDGGADGGGMDTDTGEDKPSGLGEPCTESGGECEQYKENFCAWNFISGTGYCTSMNCTPLSCEQKPDMAYKCCDCTASELLPKEKACLNSEDASLAVQYAGCTCDP